MGRGADAVTPRKVEQLISRDAIAERGASHPETRSTRGSNMLRLALHRPEGSGLVVILVVQDNLVKGASGQAVQCMNLMFGLPETAGLQHIALLP